MAAARSPPTRTASRRTGRFDAAIRATIDSRTAALSARPSTMGVSPTPRSFVSCKPLRFKQIAYLIKPALNQVSSRAFDHEGVRVEITSIDHQISKAGPGRGNSSLFKKSERNALRPASLFLKVQCVDALIIAIAWKSDPPAAHMRLPDHVRWTREADELSIISVPATSLVSN